MSIMETIKETECEENDTEIKTVSWANGVTGSGINKPNFDRDLTGQQATPKQLNSRPRTPKKHHAAVKETIEQDDFKNTILLQPEIQLMKLEKERQQEKLKLPKKIEEKPLFSNEQLSLLSRFPWMADQIKSAITNLREGNAVTGVGRLKSALSQQTQATSQAGILKTRKNQPHSLRRDSDQSSDETKVVFNRNVPMLIYNKNSQKCIKVGGDRDPNQGNLEALYRAVNFNPELKKVTLDLQDLLHPEKERTLRLSVNYMSANTLHNPYVITDDMCKFSHKKELMIKLIITEIERRLLFQRDGREQRAQKQQKQEEEMKKQKEEEELRGRDFIVSNRLLAASKQVDKSLLTDYEKKQERQRRIRLRTKSIPVMERSEQMVRQRKMGVPFITLKNTL